MDKLEFNVVVWRDGERKVINIFDSYRVCRSVCLYRLGEFNKWYPDKPERWFFWCFGDMWSRYEWEVGFGEPFLNSDGSWDGEKVDVYSLFLEPNKKLLKKMIDRVSLNSCREWLRENKR